MYSFPLRNYVYYLCFCDGHSFYQSVVYSFLLCSNREATDLTSWLRRLVLSVAADRPLWWQRGGHWADCYPAWTTLSNLSTKAWTDRWAPSQLGQWTVPGSPSCLSCDSQFTSGWQRLLILMSLTHSTVSSVLIQYLHPYWPSCTLMIITCTINLNLPWYFVCLHIGCSDMLIYIVWFLFYSELCMLIYFSHALLIACIYLCSSSQLFQHHLTNCQAHTFAVFAMYSMYNLKSSLKTWQNFFEF